MSLQNSEGINLAGDVKTGGYQNCEFRYRAVDFTMDRAEVSAVTHSVTYIGHFINWKPVQKFSKIQYILKIVVS